MLSVGLGVMSAAAVAVVVLAVIAAVATVLAPSWRVVGSCAFVLKVNVSLDVESGRVF